MSSDFDDVELPYDGTEGYSGSETSKERAKREAESGTASKRQKQILDYLKECRSAGAIWSEVGAEIGVGHGTSSGTLSVLHKAGKVARLAQRRHRCEVYVLPEFVNGRETRPHNPNKKGIPVEQYEAMKSRAEEAEAEVIMLKERIARMSNE